VAGVVRPARSHGWHKWPSRLRMRSRSRTHLLSYPRSCLLLPLWCHVMCTPEMQKRPPVSRGRSVARLYA